MKIQRLTLLLLIIFINILCSKDFDNNYSINETISAQEKLSIKTYDNIFIQYYKQGDYKKALLYCKKALKIREKVLDKNSIDVAINYNNIARLYKYMGNYRFALKYYKKSLKIIERTLGKNHTYAIAIYNNIAMLYKAMGNYKSAFKYLNKAVNKSETILGNRHLYTATSYNNMGLYYQDLNNYKKALKYYKKALNIDKKILGENSIYTAKTYNNIASVYRAMDNYKQALIYYKKSLKIDINILGENHLETATSYNSLGLFYQEIGNYREALKYLNKALNIIKNLLGENNEYIVKSYNNIALVYKAIANYKEAIKYINKALEIDKKILGENHIKIAKRYNSIALIYQDMGYYNKAFKYYKKALKIYSKTGKNFIDIAFTYNNIASFYQDLGDYKNAFEYYNKALKINKKILGKNNTDTATSYNNIGLLYQEMGKYKEALAYLREALKIFKNVLGKNHIYTAKIYNNIGGIYKFMGDYKKALNYYNKALKIDKKILGKNSIDTAKVYNSLGLLYQNIKDYKLAFKYLNKALKIVKNKLWKNHPYAITAYNNLAWLYKDLKDYKQAYIYAKKSYDIFIVNRDNNFQILSNRQKKFYLRVYSYKIPLLLYTAYLYGENEPNKKSLLAKTTFNDWLNFKGSIFDSENAIAMLYESTKDKKLKEKLEELMQTKRSFAKLYKIFPESKKEKEIYNKRVEELKQKISDLEQEIASKAVAFKEALGLRKVSYKDIAKNLKDNELYIDYAKAGSSYYIFTLDNKENITFKQIDKNETKEIDKNVKLFRNDIDTIVNSSKLSRKEMKILQEHSKNVLAKLYELALKKPLKYILPKYSKLIISPDGALRLLPFEALYDEDNGKYIIEERNIKYVPSGKEFIRLFKYTKTTKANKQIVVFANPKFNAHIEAFKKIANADISRGGFMESLYDSVGIFEPLPETKKEADIIKKLFAKSVIEYEDNNATEENLLSIKKPKILHIATHGFFINNKNISNPMLKSGIALAGANIGIKKFNGEGVVTALNLSGLNLKGTNLVVLSACETGVVDVNSTQSVSGLAKAFIQAGAKDIVMSLWSVSDKASKDLMAQFYKNIKAGSSYTQALKSAKLEMIKQKLHPLYWAGFILSGM